MQKHIYILIIIIATSKLCIGQRLNSFNKDINIEGNYECHKYDAGGKNNWHYVTIKKDDNGTYVWENNANRSWSLYPTTSPLIFKVSENCPYFKTYKTAKAVIDSNNAILGIWGPSNEFYSFEEALKPNENKPTKQKQVSFNQVLNHGDRELKFSPIYVNNEEVTRITVEPGEKVTLTATWSSEYKSAHCPACIQQYYIGIKDEFIQCIYSGFTNTDFSKNITFTFDAPQQKGRYILEADSSLDYSCTRRPDQLKGKKDHLLLYIIVK
ncbi:MAG: hypothetical protein MK066_03875 [Crocinitomicaceae bacterium]|nr:hypothetical protein [Crocinitomicaceae bacterium]